jgi:hypothetical protein
VRIGATICWSQRLKMHDFANLKIRLACHYNTIRPHAPNLQHRRSSCQRSPRGRFRHVDRLRRPCWRSLTEIGGRETLTNRFPENCSAKYLFSQVRNVSRADRSAPPVRGSGADWMKAGKITCRHSARKQKSDFVTVRERMPLHERYSRKVGHKRPQKQ